MFKNNYLQDIDIFLYFFEERDLSIKLIVISIL